jgi:uncharacterized membrane protein
MFYVISREDISIKLRRILFILFGLGMTLSHYTTTYIIIASLIVLVCVRPTVKWIGHHLGQRKLFSHAGYAALARNTGEKWNITAGMVTLLVIAAFLWSSVLTNTASGSISRVFSETVQVILHPSKGDTQSSDTHYGLFSFQKIDPTVALQDYVKKFVIPTRTNISPNAYYAPTTYSNFVITATSTNALPLTSVGSYLSTRGVNVPLFNYAFRQISAKLLQIFILLGCITLLFIGRYLKKPLETEYVLIAVAGIFSIVLQILLPVLSQEYGLLRAFQQALMFLGIFIVMGSIAVVFYLKKERSATIFAGTVALIFFLSSTGVFTQLLGGYDPQMHLNNAGTYYDLYYLHAGEIAASNWLSVRIDVSSGDELQSQSKASFYAVQKATSIIDTGPLNDIYPGLIRKHAYVYLNFENIRKQLSTVSYNGTDITYLYPITFLDDTKDLIYDNSEARIYR